MINLRNLWFPEEKVLRRVILPDLKRGRKDFDLPHTEAVVLWMKKLLTSLKGSRDQGYKDKFDVKVMITAAYAHDWGYIDLFKDGDSYEQIQLMKPRHMQVGARRVGKLLKNELAASYSKAQTDQVSHLVRVHDQLDRVKTEEELLLVEADTLGALDTDMVKPTFSKLDNDKYLVELERARRPLFIHKAAIEAYDELIKKRIGFYE